MDAETKHFLELYTKFECLALDLIGRGRVHYGAHGIIEVLRFHHTIEARDPNSTFKICNTYEPLLARIFELLNPAHDEFFTMRRSQFDDFDKWPAFAKNLTLTLMQDRR